ncbi:PHP domain-containing protein [Aquaticitalea lipolytica]|uniref:PHP domain-containing protein n=1 Tax=Aquaticitalea lipolytica TaxID=1247562 RepID=UPI0024BB25BC|nr:PHP domain-containing protein [Aquaticitalea lipolytica]
MKPYRANFHTHTIASFDGYNSYKAIYFKCKQANINLIAITDHDTVDGAYGFINWLEQNNKKDLEVIIGEEVTCTDGTHIIGLFINKFIPSDTPLNVIQQIKLQNGLVYFPHPARKDGIMQSEFYKEAIKLGDAFEVFNAKINNDFNEAAQNEIVKHPHLIPLGGSDAHYNSDILKCVCEIDLDTQNLNGSLLSCNKESIQIFGLIKQSGDNNYFSSYYKVKNKLNLPQFVRNLGKFAFPLYKNFKERNTSYKLENVFNK